MKKQKSNSRGKPQHGKTDLKAYEPLIESFERDDISKKLEASDDVDSEIKNIKRKFVVTVESDIARRLISDSQ